MKFFLSTLSLKLGRLCICLLFLMLAACGDDERGPASVGVMVTGLEDDETVRKAKTWNWDCEEDGEEVDCEYRYTVTKTASHDFEDDDYEEDQSATTIDGLDGKHYIHVQAKSEETEEESEVATVSVTLDNTLPNEPDPNNFEVPASSVDSQVRITVKNLTAGDTVRIYVDDPDDTGSSGFLSNAWSLVSPVFNLMSMTSSDNTVCSDEDNKVGEATVGSGQTEVVIDVDVNVSENEYYAVIEDPVGNVTACVKVFTYENIFVPEPPAPTACSSIKESSSDWKFASNDAQNGNAKTEEGLCRPKCLEIARLAGYSGSYERDVDSDTCKESTKNGRSDWEEFEIEDGGQTISSNDASEVAERGGVCCKRGTASNPISPPMVTGIETDTTPRLEKTFTWDCDRVTGCEYRYAINKYSAHTFPESTKYTPTTTVTKTHGDRRTKYYLHVQAASSFQESAVKSISFVLIPPVPPKVTGLEDDPTPKASKTWTWGCDKSSCTYRYVINQDQTHTFTNEAYGSDTTATKTITSASDNGTYYLHVQAMDSESNESEVETVLAVFEISADGDTHVTGLMHDTNAGSSKTWNWGCDKGSCTYRYAINQDQEHTFTNEDLYDSTTTETKSISSASENGTYFLHVQAKDSAGNESDVRTVVVVLEIGTAINDVFVTNLNHDTNAGSSKTWNWGCNKRACTYRHVVNQNPTHTFSSSTAYNSTTRAAKTISSANDNGTYYLHVQAKDSSNNNESEVETVLAVIEVLTTTGDVFVTGLDHDTNAGDSKTWNWACNQLPCTYRHVVNQSQTHTFSGSSAYNSTQRAVKTITSASEDGTYYLHVQAKDSNNDESEVRSVLAVFEFPDTTGDVRVTGISHDDVPKTSKTWNWSCNQLPCTYRAVINQNSTHTFGSTSSYGSATRAAKSISSASDNGIYYLHVQARDANNNESEVETVIAVLEISADGEVRVTGLEHDTDPKRRKAWTWDCDNSPCTYRHAVNQAQEHTFSSSDSYTSTKEATKEITSSSQDGTYYLHVQAKDANNNESDVETVLVILRYRGGLVGDLAVTGVEDDIIAKVSKTWRWYCTNNSGACEYRYVINQSDTHTFPDSHSFDSSQMAKRTASVDDDNGTYYLHVQARDGANNLSAIRTVVAYLSKSPVELTLTCTPHNTVGKSMNCIWSGGTEFRYIINQSATHIFEANAPYGFTNGEVIEVAGGRNAGTTYYIHVQSKDGTLGDLSNIETRFITLTAKTIEVKFIEDETKKLNKMSAKWKWECDTTATEAATKPCVYRHAITQESSHTFDNDDGYGNTDELTKTLTHKGEDGTYYLHVQTKDADNNVSEVKSSAGVELAFELDLMLKDPKPHTIPTGDEEIVALLQLHLDETPTFTLRGVQENHRVTLYSSPECTDGSNDGNGDPTQDTRLSDEVTMSSSGQIDITIPNDKFSDLTTYPIYVGVKDSNNDIECYAGDSDNDDIIPATVEEIIADGGTVAPLFEYTRYNPIAGGLDKTCYLLPDGDVQCWGDETATPASVDSNKAKAVVVGGKSNSICRILEDDTVTCTGSLFATESSTDKVKAIALGGGHACSILKEDNSVYCGGSTVNDKGQLGLGAKLSGGVVKLGCDGDVNNDDSCNSDELKAKAIAAGDNHTCVILLDDNETNPSDDFNDRVLCWGYNAKGQLGQDDTLNHGAEIDADSQDDQPSLISSLPYINLGSGRTAKSIVAGQNHTCALLDNNTVKCWGHNILGQLGQNNVIDYGAVKSGDETSSNKSIDNLGAISLGRSASSIFTGVGSNHTCAVLDNNTVRCWGNNWKGQLGQNNSTNVDGGTAIGSDSDDFLDGSEILINRNHGSGSGSDVPLKTGEPRSNVQTRTVSSLSIIQFGCNEKVVEGRGTPPPCTSTSANKFKLKVPYGVAVGKDHVCALLETSQQSDEGKDFVKCWGSNTVNQLGCQDGTGTDDCPGVDKTYGGGTTDTVEAAPFLEFDNN